MQPFQYSWTVSIIIQTFIILSQNVLGSMMQEEYIDIFFPYDQASSI